MYCNLFMYTIHVKYTPLRCMYHTSTYIYNVHVYIYVTTKAYCFVLLAMNDHNQAVDYFGTMWDWDWESGKRKSSFYDTLDTNSTMTQMCQECLLLVLLLKLVLVLVVLLTSSSTHRNEHYHCMSWQWHNFRVLHGDYKITFFKLPSSTESWMIMWCSSTKN